MNKQLFKDWLLIIISAGAIIVAVMGFGHLPNTVAENKEALSEIRLILSDMVKIQAVHISADIGHSGTKQSLKDLELRIRQLE